MRSFSARRRAWRRPALPSTSSGSAHCSRAAHGRPVAASPLRQVSRALETWPHDKPLALTHLALSGLAKLTNPKEDAWRLFLADALIDAGVAPSVIAKGLGLESSPFDAGGKRYNPDQPRVPAGNSDGGQWTSSTASTSAESRTANDNDPTFELAQADLDQTCSAFIAANCKARILRVFPGQCLDCTLREVQAAAKLGDAAAKTACKLLNRGIYRK